LRLLKPQEITPGVYQLRGIAAKVTVIAGGDDVVMVDAGSIGSVGLLKRGLAELGLSIEQVSLAVTTHYHPDHIGGLSGLMEASSAKVAAHRLESDMLIRNKPFDNPFQNSVIAGVASSFLPHLYGSPVNVSYPLDDGDRLPVSEDIHVIHTPGHTRGSICLYVVSKKVIIVGDALQYRFRRLSLPAALVTWNMGHALESARKLLDVDFETICFSHFPPLRTRAKDELRWLVDKSSLRMGSS
jgi:glyoxylase-like metal-dependent hydrolase (beta-lactamase superfamily II)